jgi:hypothetical protein
MTPNKQESSTILNSEITSKIKLFLALSSAGVLAWLAYAGLTPPSITKTFRAETLQFNGKTTATFCLESKTESSLFSKKTIKFPQVEQYQQEKNYRQKIKSCQADFDEAIAHDEVLESALYKDHLDDFFKRVQALEPHTQSRVLMLNLPTLPKTLAAQLEALPKGHQMQLTAFDIALAAKRVDDVIATMPNPEDVLPHQRQALFHLGAFSSVEQASVNSDQTLAEEKLNNYQAQMNTAIVTGNPQLAASALSTLSNIISGTGMANRYTDYRGGFSEYDFLMANQACDVQYATFLTSKKIQPTARHVLHLLSVIGHAQYPEIGSEFSNTTFTFADPALGAPSATTLPQCVALAKVYATQVNDLNDPELQFSNGYSQTNVYDELYKIAHDGVFQWWVRDDEKQYHNGRARNTTVNGDPALLINAVAEILKQQPPSFEQYCGWANNAHTWMALVKETQPSMVASILNLPKQWKNTPFIYRHPHRACNLSVGITNEYQTQKDGLAFMNNVLKQVEIPCSGTLVEEAGAYQLSCQGTTKPWPSIAPTTDQ